MSRLLHLRAETLGVSLLAGLTTWVTLLSWDGFAESPSGYLAPLAGACLLVAVLGAVLRAVRLPAIGVVVVQVGVVAVWLIHRFAGAGSPLGWVPTPTSVQAAADAVVLASTSAQGYAAPVPASVPEFYPLLILAGASTAVIVDLLAVGLRRVPLAGLPLLAAYTAPISIMDGGVSWPSFSAIALCFVFLIAAVEGGRLARWGRRLSPGPGLFEVNSTPAAAGSGGVWSSARKIGLTATAVALVVPLLLPTFSGTLFGGAGGGGVGTGDAVSISNPMVDLKRDLARGPDVDLVSVDTTDPDPAYLRLTVLNSFDGNAWRPADRDIPVEQRADGTVPRPAALEADVSTRPQISTFSVSDFFDTLWLPTPYPSVAVEVPGDWRYDSSTLDFISANDGVTAAGLTYRIRSLDVSPTAAQLAEAPSAPVAVSEPNTILPRDFPGSVRRLARSVAADRPSAFEKAVALQQWFRTEGGFEYSLERSSGNGTDDLVEFLGTGPESRVGYCEQFAAAMAVMGRTLGIPSRVAVGFLRPDQRGDDDYVYSAHDLHAWPEMYFGGVGWIRFEPTPQARTGTVPGYTTQQVPAPAPSSTASSSQPVVPNADSLNRPTDQQAAAGGTTDERSPAATVLLVGALAGLLVLALLAPRVLRALVRRRRWEAADDPAGWVEAGWREVADTARDLGIAWDDHLTLRTTAAALQQSFGAAGGEDADGMAHRPRRGPEADPEATAALHRLVELLERARYARALPAGATSEAAVEADVRTCVHAMEAGAGRRRVVRGRWLPASLATSLVSRRRRSTRSARRLTAGPGIDRAV
jgi:transglutaminase-like putative cysteine protease